LPNTISDISNLKHKNKIAVIYLVMSGLNYFE